MQILITNDDGYDAPGLKALFDAVSGLGNVTVVAPSECHSSRGHAVEVQRNIRVWPTSVEGVGTVHVVDSSPADCTRMALQVVCESPPDIVIAGINPGANLGVDVYYSGTVAAAREAAIAGVASMAVSRYMKKNVPLIWSEVSALASQAIRRVIDEPTKPGEFWNVNLPAISGAPIRGLAFVPHSTEPQRLGFEAVHDEDGMKTFAFAGNYQQRPAAQAADVRHVFDGYATATRLQLDTSANPADRTTTEPFPG
jgi:5'-nucleotidase